MCIMKECSLKSGLTKIAVIGLGYVGLPLAALCAKQGYKTTGLDTNEDIVSKLTVGQCHIRDEAVELLIKEAQATKKLSGDK